MRRSSRPHRRLPALCRRQDPRRLVVEVVFISSSSSSSSSSSPTRACGRDSGTDCAVLETRTSAPPWQAGSPAAPLPCHQERLKLSSVGGALGTMGSTVAYGHHAAAGLDTKSLHGSQADRRQPAIRARRTFRARPGDRSSSSSSTLSNKRVTQAVGVRIPADPGPCWL